MRAMREIKVEAKIFINETSKIEEIKQIIQAIEWELKKKKSCKITISGSYKDAWESACIVMDILNDVSLDILTINEHPQQGENQDTTFNIVAVSKKEKN